jgi:hypothetical protein
MSYRVTMTWVNQVEKGSRRPPLRLHGSKNNKMLKEYQVIHSQNGSKPSLHIA